MSRTNFCSNCGAMDYGTPYCPKCQAPMNRDEYRTSDPALQIESVPAPPPVRLAGFFRRFFALLIDYLLLGILSDLISISYRTGAGGSFHAMRINVFFGISTLLALIYFTILIGESGQTLGKRLLGVRVIRTDGTSVSFGRALGRALGYYVSSLFFSLGFLWAAFDRRNQTWHDKLVDTLVVRT